MRRGRALSSDQACRQCRAAARVTEVAVRKPLPLIVDGCTARRRRQADEEDVMTKHFKPAEPKIPHFLAQSATFHDMVAQLAAEIDDKGGPGAGADYMADFVLNELEPRGVLVATRVHRDGQRGPVYRRVRGAGQGAGRGLRRENHAADRRDGMSWSERARRLPRGQSTVGGWHP